MLWEVIILISHSFVNHIALREVNEWIFTAKLQNCGAGRITLNFHLEQWSGLIHQNLHTNDCLDLSKNKTFWLFMTNKCSPSNLWRDRRAPLRKSPALWSQFAGVSNRAWILPGFIFSAITNRLHILLGFKNVIFHLSGTDKCWQPKGTLRVTWTSLGGAGPSRLPVWASGAGWESIYTFSGERDLCCSFI